MIRADSFVAAFKHRAPEALRVLRDLYGDDLSLVEERRRAYVQVGEEFCRRFDPAAGIVVSRAPGRVNLMGRHVDHRGGFCNPLALNLEVLLAASPRADDRFVLHNCDPRYESREFVLGEELPPRKTRSLAEWDEWTLHQVERRTETGLTGHWTVYVQAAAVSFQDLLRDDDGTLHPALTGMNAVVLGNVPASAGLSSSSALFVSAAEALLHLNGVTYPPEEFVDHCGRGEWYVGTRGGSGDHAAMKFGRQGKLSHVGFFPTSISHVDFPANYRVVIADSKDEASKARGAREIFNQRVAAYEFGLLLLRERFPDHAPRMEHLRDVNPDTLGVSEAEIYAMLKVLPSRAVRADLRRALPVEMHERLEDIFAAHAEPEDGYRVRDVCLFGIAECLRSRDCLDLLAAGDTSGFGQLMNVSHDGDRVVRYSASGEPTPFSAAVDDAALDSLARRSRTGDSAAALRLQPGGYACSTPRVDRMVDLTLAVPGVVGAQISGAGLGGCMMCLVEKEKTQEVIDRLAKAYYGPQGLAPAVYVCTPVEGAGIVSFG